MAVHSQGPRRVGPAAARLLPLWLFLFALAIRVPKFDTIPAPTDETDELLVALTIYRDGALPLTTSEPYLGPLHVYLQAAAFHVFGPTLGSARFMALLLGALAAPAAFWLGRRLQGTVAGVVAGCLTACAFGLVVLASHVAWGHGSAPTFVAAAFAAGVGALRTRGRARALLAGVAGGLAVGAHPTVVALAPGAAVWWFLHDQGWRRPELTTRVRQGVWAGLGAAIAYIPGILFITRYGIAPIRERMGAHEYVGFNLASWPAGIVMWLESLARNLAGPAQATSFDIGVGVFGLLIALSLLSAARVGVWLPLAVISSAAVFMPILVAGDKFGSLTGLRYAAPALPVAIAAIGVWMSDWWNGGGSRRALATLIVAFTVAVQVWSIGAYLRTTESTGITGEPVLSIVDGLVTSAPAEGQVFIDEEFDTKLIGGGEVGRAVGALLTMQGTPFTKARADKIRWFLVNGDGATYDLVLTENTVRQLGLDVHLEPVRVVQVVPGQVSRSGQSWGWYRFTSPRTND